MSLERAVRRQRGLLSFLAQRTRPAPVEVRLAVVVRLVAVGLEVPMLHVFVETVVLSEGLLFVLPPLPFERVVLALSRPRIALVEARHWKTYPRFCHRNLLWW